MTETELLITAADAAGGLLAVVAVAVLRIMWDVQAMREVNDAWYAEATDEPAPRLFDRLGLPTEFTPREAEFLDAGYARLQEAVLDLPELDDEAPLHKSGCGTHHEPGEECPPREAQDDVLAEVGSDFSPSDEEAKPEPTPESSDELPNVERPCGGTHKNHKYVDAQGTRQADCIRCGSPDRAHPKKVTSRAPRAPKPAEPVADPVGAHVSGPATSKASTTGRTRAERRGGAAGELSILGTQKETSTAPATVIEDASREFCPRGHGRFLVTNDEYGDPDPHCITCGGRPLAENAEELMREATEPREGAQRRRAPRTAGMRI